MNADLTVLIQTFNRPERIISLIGSLEFEDLTGIEILVVDNGSDEENERLREALGRISNTRFVRKEKNCICVKCGQSVIDLVKSKYLLNPGDDDLIVPKSLQKLRQEILEKSNFDVLLTAMDVVDENENKIGSSFFPKKEEIENPRLMLAQLLKANYISWPSTVFKPEMFKVLSDESFRYRTALDWAFWILNSPNMKIKTSDLKVIKYVRHETNESAVVVTNQQIQESVSMRLRAISSPILKSALIGYSVKEASELLEAINKLGGLSGNMETKIILSTSLIQGLSFDNQQIWEPYLMGLGMVPWDANSFEITHHVPGDFDKYLLGYPVNLVFDQNSCLSEIAQRLGLSDIFNNYPKDETFALSCNCSSKSPVNRVVVDCSDLIGVNEKVFIYKVLLSAESQLRSSYKPANLEGLEFVLIKNYRKLKRLIPRKFLYIIRRILR
jgi:glycosyltransferase involved in cell wall biosynthesis